MVMTLTQVRFSFILILIGWLGSTLSQKNDARGFVCPNEGLYTNPFDCGGYYQCANGIKTPYVRKCAPGSHFDESQRNCFAIPDVNCNGRPVVDNTATTERPTHSPRLANIRSNAYQSNFQATSSISKTDNGNSVTLRLNSRQTGPILRSEQCADIGRQMTRYLKTLVSNFEPTCSVNSVCQQNLPFFKVECQTATGRVVV